MHDLQVLTRDMGFELALSTWVSSAQFLNQQMCDNIDEFEDDIWTRLDRKDALFYFANTQKMIGNMDNKNPLISLIMHLDNKKISLMMTTIISLSNPSH